MVSTCRYMALALLIIIGGMSPSLATSFAATQDYRLEVINQPVKAGRNSTFSVQLTQISTGKTITDAVITHPDLQMIMGSMNMPVPVRLLPSDEKGSYKFGGDLTMRGEYILDFIATMAKDKERVHLTVKVQVVK